MRKYLGFAVLAGLLAALVSAPVTGQQVARLFGTDITTGAAVPILATSGALNVSGVLGASAWPITAPNGGKLTAGATAGMTACIAAWDTDTGPTDTCLLTATSGTTPSLTALFHQGTAAAPSIAFIGDANTGIYAEDGRINFALDGVQKAQIGPNVNYFVGNIQLAPSTIATDSAVLSSEGLGIFQFSLDSASPVSYTLKGADRITSDGGGANVIIGAGRGRGAAGGTLSFQTAPTIASGNPGVLATRLLIEATGAATFGTTAGVGVGTVYAAAFSGGLLRVEQPGTDTLSAQEMRGSLITNYGQVAENTQTLPAMAGEYYGEVLIETAGAGAFHFKAAADDRIGICSGGTITWLDDGDKVSFATPAVGDRFTFAAVRVGASAYDIIVYPVQGTLTDGGV